MMPRRSLILNGAGAGRGQSNLIALMEADHVLVSQVITGRGASERFAPTVHEMLSRAAWQQPPELVAAVVGPGSFTGLRASLSLVAGLVRGWSCRAVGVRLGDALRATVARQDVTALCLARRGRVFVDEPGRDVYALSVEDALSSSWPAVAGDAVSGEDALPDIRAWLQREKQPYVACASPTAQGILQAAMCMETSYPLKPLYVDPPEAKPPADGLRPAPF